MSVRFWIAPFVFSAGLVALPIAQRPAANPPLDSARGRPAQAAQDPAPAQDPDQTTIDDQVDLAVTVYNSDIALVRDVRELRLPRGVAELQFMDIAATVNPATVHFRSL